MFEYNIEQKVASVGNVKIGGQPGENPIVMVGTIFYTKHAALLDEKKGEFDKKMLESELNEFVSIVEDTGMQAIVDVVGSYPDTLLKECLYIADLVDCPFLVDGLNDSSRIPTMEGLQEVGLLDRAILNSIDENTGDESLKRLKRAGVKNAVLLTFSNRAYNPINKIKLLKEVLLVKAEKAGIINVIVDTAVLDLVSIGVNLESTRLIKKELGLPTGFAPANAIYGWDYVKKYGESARCGAIASVMAYSSASDYILFGPVKFAKCVVPSMALISGINSYYRKRILRKTISEQGPLKKIF
ncbi:MAG: hypothetical protein JW891_13160 [Candidatus Lokiarchaeota archaeon]|nr:hypothetical protein [Candidatus Lokiarchaeota archaeon]